MCHHLLTRIWKYHTLSPFPRTSSLLSRPFLSLLPPPTHAHSPFCSLTSSSQLWEGKLGGCHIQRNTTGKTTSRETPHIPFSPTATVSPTKNKYLPLVFVPYSVPCACFSWLLFPLLWAFSVTPPPSWEPLLLRNRKIFSSLNIYSICRNSSVSRRSWAVISDSLQLYVFSFYRKAPKCIIV